MNWRPWACVGYNVVSLAIVLLALGVLWFAQPSHVDPDEDVSGRAAHVLGRSPGAAGFSALPAAATTTHRLSSAASTCMAAGTGCARLLVQMMNGVRATVASPPLRLDWYQARGSATCLGARGHVQHLVAVVTSLGDFGTYAHDQFPGELCESFGTAGQNVGEAGGSKYEALVTDFNQMMAEGHTPLGTCLFGHDCNIAYRGYDRVGIAIAYSPAVQGWFVVQDFIGG